MDQQEYQKDIYNPKQSELTLSSRPGDSPYCCNSKKKVRVRCYMLTALRDSWFLGKLV